MNMSEAGKLGYLKSKDKLLDFINERKKSARLKYKNNKCKNCNKNLPYEKRKNKFCSHSCAATYNNIGNCKNIEGKNGTIYNKKIINKNEFCLFCGNKLSKRQYKFCNIFCYKKYSYNSYIEKWKNNEVSGSDKTSERLSIRIRKYIFQKYENKCCKCGWNEKNPKLNKSQLQINHIDGNPTNNTENNLELLCPNCHSLTPNFGGLNYGNGRKYRRVSKEIK